MPAAVLVDDLQVWHGLIHAVDGLSFLAEPGEVLVVLGPNGAGKTTTIDTLLGFRRPDAGKVRVLGLDPHADHDRLMPQIGVMLQEGGVHPGIRVEEMVHLIAALHGTRADTDAVINRVGMGGRRRSTWRQLSGGEKQRLSLATALVARPQVAFLDEPTAGVDVRGRQVIRDIVRELRDRGCCVVLSTHELDEAEKVADRVVIVDQGRAVASGRLDELKSSIGRVRFTTKPGLDVLALGNQLGHVVTQARPGEYEILASGTPELVRDLMGWLAERELALGGIEAGRESLEDVFLQLTSAPDDAEVDDAASPAGGRRRRGRRA